MSGDLTSFSISLELALNVFALSDIRVEGNPRLLENRRNACKNEFTLRSHVSSKWTVRVDAHVNKQI